MIYKDRQDNREIQTPPEKKLNIKKLETARWVQQETDRSIEKLAEKPFAQEFKPLKRLAHILLWVLSVVSIVTAISYFYYRFADNVGKEVAILLALLLLTGIEAGKNQTFDIAFTRAYSKGFSEVTAILFLGAGVFLAGSVYTSLEGAKEAYIHIDRTAQQQEAQHTTRTDSTRLAYQTRIEQTRQDLNEFRKSVSWQGQINIYDKNVADNIRAYQDRIAKFERDRDQLIKTATANHTTQREETARTQGFNIWFWVIFAGITEALLILCNWFLIWYAYHTAEDPKKFRDKETNAWHEAIQILTSHAPNIFKDLLNSPQDLPKTYQVLNQDLQQDLPKKPIGFTAGKQDLPQDLQQDLPQDLPQDLQQDLPATLEEAYRQGITDTRILSKAYKKNFSTLSKVRKKVEGREAPPKTSLFDSFGNPIAGKEVRHV